MHSEGFCKDMVLESEFLDGRVYIDGYFTHDIGVGDAFHVDSKPEYRLKCIRFLLWLLPMYKIDFLVSTKETLIREI